jgi:hypothetical protein
MRFLRFAQDDIAVVALCAMIALLVPRERAETQGSTGTVAGTVTVMGSDRPLAGVSILIDELQHTATSDSAGRFRIIGVPAGDRTLTARRIGFGSVTARIAVTAGSEVGVDVELQASTVQQLGEVKVTADSQRFVGRLAGMEHRRSINAGGTFITSAELDSMADRSLPYVLARKLSGAQLTMNGRNGAMLLSSGRGRTSGRTLPPADPYDPKSPRGCWAQVYLDGVRIYSIKHGGMPVPDLRDYRVETLSAIEYYAGEAQTPSEFAGEGAACGTIVIWTK